MRKTGLAAISLREDDELIEVKFTDNKKDIILVTKFGQCICFMKMMSEAQEEFPWV